MPAPQRQQFEGLAHLTGHQQAPRLTRQPRLLKRTTGLRQQFIDAGAQQKSRLRAEAQHLEARRRARPAPRA